MVEKGSSGTGGHVLVVDDDVADTVLLSRLLTHQGYHVSVARNGRDAFEAVCREAPDVVLMDVVMPGGNGFEVCGAIKRNPSTRFTPVVLISALGRTADRIHGLNAQADDFVTKPFNAAELAARVRSLVRLKRDTDDLDSSEAIFLSLALTIEARDPYTEGHCERMARYATSLGSTLHLNGDDNSILYRGGFIHDLGKVGIPDALLHKPGPLTRAEFEQMKEHTTIGDHLCGSLRSLEKVRPIVRHHHERLDGTGYPDRLKGDAIPLLAQIVGIVDVYDALTTERPYKPALSRDRAFEELREEARKGWKRRDLVDAFIGLQPAATSAAISSAAR